MSYTNFIQISAWLNQVEDTVKGVQLNLSILHIGIIIIVVVSISIFLVLIEHFKIKICICLLFFEIKISPCVLYEPGHHSMPGHPDCVNLNTNVGERR